MQFDHAWRATAPRAASPASTASRTGTAIAAIAAFTASATATACNQVQKPVG